MNMNRSINRSISISKEDGKRGRKGEVVTDETGFIYVYGLG